MKWLICSFLIFNILSCFCQNNQENIVSGSNEVKQTDSLSIYYSFGMQYMMLHNNPKEAIKYFDKYINDNSGKEKYQLSGAIIKRAICKRRTNDNIGALKDLDYALKLYPNIKEIYFERGKTKEDLGDRYGAINDYTQALNCKDDGVTKNHEIYCSLTFIYSSQGKNELALNSINEAIKLSQNYGFYYMVRGDIYMFFKKHELACMDYSKAGELGHYDAYKEIQEKCK